MQIETRIKGIPCLAEVTHYNPGHNGIGPSYSTRPPIGLVDPGEPPEPEEVEFNILDRKGYPAQWLERMASDYDWIRAREDVLTAINE